jgi:hypothetical protein
MALTNAQRQALYRWRQVGLEGDLARPQLCLGLNAHDRLDRLAWHYGYSVAQLVEELAASAERAIEAQSTGAALAEYRAAGYEDAAQ